MFCTTCAARNPSNAFICHACGSRLRPAPTGEHSSQAAWVRRTLQRPHGLRQFARRVLAFTTAFILLTSGLVLAAGIDLREQRQAAAYAAAIHARDAGDLVTAAQRFAQAGTFRDAPVLLREVREALRPFNEAFAAGEVALAQGRNEEAIAAFLPIARALPNFPKVLDELEAARAASEIDALSRAEVAAARGDWETAVQAWRNVLSENPDDLAIRERLASTLRANAPIVFTRGQRLMVVRPDGQGEQTLVQDVPASWPVWSPDRSQIAFIAPSGYGNATGRRLFVVGADGQNLRELARGLRPYTWPVWSPDGQWIAYTVEGMTAGPYVQSSRWVQIVNVATGEVRDIKPDPQSTAFGPTWSPRGDRLAFVVRGMPASATVATDGEEGPPQSMESSIWVITIGTWEMRPLPVRSVSDPWRLSWSPSSEVIAVWSREDSSFQRGRIALVDAGTGAVQPVYAETYDVTVPVWSPDGTRFAFVVDGHAIRVVTLGHGQETYDFGGRLSRFLTWAPSGDALMAATESADSPAVMLTLAATPYWTQLALRCDVNGMHAGPPQWASLSPLKIVGPPTTTGTALDPAPDVSGITDSRDAIA
jgi:Tol biopolymer transport system component